VNDGTASTNTTFAVSVTSVNDLPTISTIANQTTNEDTATGAVAFTVGDQETPVASLTVTASSSNTTLVPNGNIVFGGSGANRTVTVTPAANQSGNATITVSVNDGTASTNTTFTVGVTAVNDLPAISAIANQTTNEDTATGAVAFTVGDEETPVASLTVTASSSNTTLVPNGNIVFGGSGANRTVTVTPAANQSGNATITMSVNDGTASTNTTFTVSVTSVNDLPTISTIANQTTNEDTATGAVAFTVGDVETPVASLTVTASSSNTTLLPNGNIVFGGSGANRTVMVTPAVNQNGNATITVSVNDGTVSTNTTFTVGVTAVNDLPTISTIANQTTNEDTATGAVAFTVGDQETPVSSLTVTASSSNTTLVPNGNIVFGGSGANRTVTVTPAANQNGNATITVSVSDGAASTNTTFTLGVTAVNDLPTISDISNISAFAGSATDSIAFVVGDLETAAGSLVVTGSSGNAALVPTGNIVFGGSGANRTIIVTPAVTQGGNVSITLSVSDGHATATKSFAILVKPPTTDLVSVQGGMLPQGSALANQTVSSFQIARYEVTLALWQEVRSWAVANGYTDLANIGTGSASGHPVREVSWYDAVKWCNARSQKEGFTPVYTVNAAVYRTGMVAPVVNSAANGYRLPTELEWEWAARGGALSQGFTYSGGNVVDPVAWYWSNSTGALVDLQSGKGTWHIGTKIGNELGIYDMSGNVWEYCGDIVDGGSNRRLRGGSFSSTQDGCTNTSRFQSAPDYRLFDRGFRVARNVIGNIVTVQGGTLPQSSTLANQTVAAFQVGRTEVTWGEWKTVRTWAASNGYDIGATGGGVADNYPVTEVQWYDVLKWSNAKSEMEGLSPVYSYNGTVLRTGGWQILGSVASDNIVSGYEKNGYRLPSIAEWEWAARGGVLSKGYTYSGSNVADLVAWYGANSGNATHQVAAKSPNELGIFDMSGNAMEWCWNRIGNGRYARGGTWNNLVSEYLANNQLGNWLPSVGNFWNNLGDFGFRVARNIGPKIVINGTLPVATLNELYEGFTFGVTGGNGSYTWDIIRGRSGSFESFPRGMNFSWSSPASSTAAINGTPQDPGIYSSIIRVESGGYSDEVEVQLKVIYYKVTTLATVMGPMGLAVDTVGNVYVAESPSHIIRKISPAGNVTTLAGSGYKDPRGGGWGGFADGNATSARFNWPSGLALDSSGNLFVAELGNHKIRKITASGNVTTLAGSAYSGYADGNGGLASFNRPQGVAVDINGNVYVADEYNSIVRKITTSGNVTTLPKGEQFYLYHPRGVAVNSNGTVYVADSDNFLIRVMGNNNNFNIMSLTEKVVAVEMLAINASGDIYVADSACNRIYKITKSGNVSTIAGALSPGINGYIDGIGKDARFNRPVGVAVDISGNIYVSDYNNNKIRKITPTP